MSKTKKYIKRLGDRAELTQEQTLSILLGTQVNFRRMNELFEKCKE